MGKALKSYFEQHNKTDAIRLLRFAFNDEATLKYHGLLFLRIMQIRYDKLQPKD